MVMHEKGLVAAMNAKFVGSGDKTLVLAHGFGGDQSVWNKILPYFTQKHRVLIFDWCFSGAANASNLFDAANYSSFDAFSDDLIALVDELRVKSFVYMGHSMSGMIGCIASIKRPDLFERLILLGASPRYLNAEDYEGGFEMADVENIFSNIESNFDSWAPSFAALIVGVNDPSSIEKYGKSIQRMRPETALSVAKTIFLGDYRDVLKKIEVPSTILQTTNDVAVPMAVAHYMLKKMKGIATLEIIEADGHLPQFTDPQLLINAVDRVLGFDSDEKKS